MCIVHRVNATGQRVSVYQETNNKSPQRYWKETPAATDGITWNHELTDPKKPNIWDGKGPSFNSNGSEWVTSTSFWRVLNNGYMTHYKNDAQHAVEMFENSATETAETFAGSQEREQFRLTRNQEDHRERSTETLNNIGVGKRNVPTDIYNWMTREMMTVLRCKETIRKGYDHDSHGKHGRKPKGKKSARTTIRGMYIN